MVLIFYSISLTNSEGLLEYTCIVIRFCEFCLYDVFWLYVCLCFVWISVCTTWRVWLLDNRKWRESFCFAPLVTVGLLKLVSLVAFLFSFLFSVESNTHPCSCAHVYSGLPFPQLYLMKWFADLLDIFESSLFLYFSEFFGGHLRLLNRKDPFYW